MTLRNLARIGATGALAVGALGLAATPALAADVDFGLAISGTTIAADAPGKLASVTITNLGTTTPEKVDISYDFSGLDPKKVRQIEPDCAGADKEFCLVEGPDVPKPGRSFDKVLVPLEKVPGAKGAAGKLTITLKVAGDTNKANDSKTVNVTVGDNGADLTVLAEDVTVFGKEAPTDKPVPPGTVAPLLVAVINQGDRTAAGVKIVIKLPKQTTVAGQVKDCSASADKRTLTCTYKDLNLLPVTAGAKPEDVGTGQAYDVLVDADAKGPVSLKGGVVTATAIAQKAFSARQARVAAELPKGFSRPTAAQLAKLDADLGDNTDEFAVLVAGSATGGGGSADNGDDEGDDNGGGLPLTGPAGYAIGGTGLAAIAVGLGLFVAARRRRVVLVTPGDEK